MYIKVVGLGGLPPLCLNRPHKTHTYLVNLEELLLRKSIICILCLQIRNRLHFFTHIDDNFKTQALNNVFLCYYQQKVVHGQTIVFVTDVYFVGNRVRLAQL